MIGKAINIITEEIPTEMRRDIIPVPSCFWIFRHKVPICLIQIRGEAVKVKWDGRNVILNIVKSNYRDDIFPLPDSIILPIGKIIFRQELPYQRLGYWLSGE